MCLHKPTECTTLRVSSKVNYGLRVIVMCQHRFIVNKKSTILANDADKGEGFACVGKGGIWEIPEPSA